MNKQDYFFELLDDNYDPELAAIMAGIYDNLNYYFSNEYQRKKVASK